jgi:hypothetical protein
VRRALCCSCREAHQPVSGSSLLQGFAKVVDSLAGTVAEVKIALPRASWQEASGHCRLSLCCRPNVQLRPPRPPASGCGARYVFVCDSAMAAVVTAIQQRPFCYTRWQCVALAERYAQWRRRRGPAASAQAAGADAKSQGQEGSLPAYCHGVAVGSVATQIKCPVQEMPRALRRCSGRRL